MCCELSHNNKFDLTVIKHQKSFGENVKMHVVMLFLLRNSKKSLKYYIDTSSSKKWIVQLNSRFSMHHTAIWTRAQCNSNFFSRCSNIFYIFFSLQQIKMISYLSRIRLQHSKTTMEQILRAQPTHFSQSWVVRQPVLHIHNMTDDGWLLSSYWIHPFTNVAIIQVKEKCCL